jgi:hypothetical protein
MSMESPQQEIVIGQQTQDTRSRSPSPDGKPPVKKFHNGWTKQQEKLMADWSDIAACYRWLHDRSEKIYHKKNLTMTIPVIILSTLTGSANIGLDTFFSEGEQAAKRYATIGIGALSLFAGMITTLGNFFRFAQLSEAHRVASISWGKFQRLIAVELAIHPNERMDCMDFLKICRAELDRLIEQSPQIPDSILKQFEQKFGTIRDIKKPDICNHIEHTAIYTDTEGRLKKVAAEAALILRHKKNTLKEIVLPELEKRIEEEILKRTTAIEKKHEETIEERLEEMKDKLSTAVVPEKKRSETEIKAFRGRSRFDFNNERSPSTAPVNIVVHPDTYKPSDKQKI